LSAPRQGFLSSYRDRGLEVMIHVRRLLAVGALLAGAVALTGSDLVWGEPGRDKALAGWRKGDGKNVKPIQVEAPAAERETSGFEAPRAAVYRAGKDDPSLALQPQPRLDDAPARPKDYLVIIDTSASKAQGPLAEAVLIAQQLADPLGADDRL